jgi:hypothetical protein
MKENLPIFGVRAILCFSGVKLIGILEVMLLATKQMNFQVK